MGVVVIIGEAPCVVDRCALQTDVEVSVGSILRVWQARWDAFGRLAVALRHGTAEGSFFELRIGLSRALFDLWASLIRSRWGRGVLFVCVLAGVFCDGRGVVHVQCVVYVGNSFLHSLVVFHCLFPGFICIWSRARKPARGHAP